MANIDRLAWRTSSYTDKGQACVEVAPASDAMLVRDTKDHGTGPILRYPYPEWAAFLAGVRDGEFDFAQP